MGTLSNALTYDAYGIPGTANLDRFGYTGQIWFKELGLFHYKARMYHPKLGRFLQTDPIFYADQMNMYAYVGNDPVNNTDPTGMFCESIATCAQRTDENALGNGDIDQDEYMARGAARGEGAAAGAAGGLAGVSVRAGVVAGAAAYRGYRYERRLNEVRKKLDGWSESSNRKKEGSRFQDPNDRGNRVRVDKGNPDHKLPTQKVDHVVEQKGGKTVDVNGNEIKPTPEAPKPASTPEAHIPLDDWLKK